MNTLEQDIWALIARAEAEGHVATIHLAPSLPPAMGAPGQPKADAHGVLFAQQVREFRAIVEDIPTNYTITKDQIGRTLAKLDALANHIVGPNKMVSAPVDDIGTESLETSEADALDLPHPLASQVAQAQAERATWTPERRANCQLQGGGQP